MLKAFCHPTFHQSPEKPPLSSSNHQQNQHSSHVPFQMMRETPQEHLLKENSPVGFLYQSHQHKFSPPSLSHVSTPPLLCHNHVWACMGHTVPCTSTPLPKEAPANLSWVCCLLLSNSCLSKHWFAWAVIDPGITDSLCGEEPESRFTHPGEFLPSSTLGRCTTGTTSHFWPRPAPPQPQRVPAPSPDGNEQSIPASWGAKCLKTHFGRSQLLSHPGFRSEFWLTQAGDRTLMCPETLRAYIYQSKFWIWAFFVNLFVCFSQLSLHSGLSHKLLSLAPVSPSLG